MAYILRNWMIRSSLVQTANCKEAPQIGELFLAVKISCVVCGNSLSYLGLEVNQ